MGTLGPDQVDALAWDRVFHPPIAHRGLWSAEGPPENSLAAFDAACEAGYGIELDVRLSADGEVMVFHDEHLARMAGAASRLAERTAAELGRLRLKASREAVPTLREALAVVDGRSLVLVEIKSRPGEEGPLDEKVSEAIEGYLGPLAIIGFNPFSHAWWRRRRPEVLRGFNLHAPSVGGAPPDAAAMARALEHVNLAEAHFLAPGRELAALPAIQVLRREGRPAVVWTVRTPGDASVLEGIADNIIFEGFSP